MFLKLNLCRLTIIEAVVVIMATLWALFTTFLLERGMLVVATACLLRSLIPHPHTKLYLFVCLVFSFVSVITPDSWVFLVTNALFFWAIYIFNLRYADLYDRYSLLSI